MTELARLAPPNCSIDSNIFLYLLDDGAPQKKERAKEIVSRAQMQSWPIAGQVLGEVYRRVQGRGWQWSRFQAKSWIDQLIEPSVILPSSASVYLNALQESSLTGRQFWDCLIAAACAAQGVKRIYTEDTGAEPHTVLGVELVNPFLREDWDHDLEFS